MNDVSPLRFDEPVMAPGAGAVAISGQVPDTYGEGDFWVYLIVRREK